MKPFSLEHCLRICAATHEAQGMPDAAKVYRQAADHEAAKNAKTDSLFSPEADELFEHEPYRLSDEGRSDGYGESYAERNV